ncbi:hypothetical protein [Chryseobacterium herbae]|uniref:DUF4178 domain-containing protein n=1 Tax=Chryseobacterium herbae TaxID=2976476 RepID=A0ABT2INV5_9FLAO|nr:hypothetical protein [Chryseobacterium sp. pc1-10]MCT2560499.1 hypothetical protein [Chryseobacterium sp. pc1-10]
MIKKYYHLSGEKITEEESSQLKEFTIKLIDSLSDFPFKEEHHIINNTIDFIQYFINDNEGEEQVFNYLCSQSEKFQIKERLIEGDFIIVTNRSYILKNGNGPLISKYVYHAEDLESTHYICIQILDDQTNLPIEERTKKYWYDTDKNGEKYEGIEFSYHEDGSLRCATDMTPNHSDEQDWEYYDAQNFQNLQNRKSADFNYYLNAELMPLKN